MIKYSYYKFNDREIAKLNTEISPDNWLNNIDWVNIYSDNRSEVLKSLPFTNLTEDIKQLILKPEDYLLTKTFYNIIIQNFVISKKTDINKSDYLTLIISQEFTICILPIDEEFDLKEEEIEHIKKQFTKIRIYYSYLLIKKILTQSTLNVSIARKKLYNIEQTMISSPDKITSSQVMTLFTQIWQLSEIVEEQYLGFNFFYNLMLNKNKEPDSDKLKEIIDSFSELSRITDRLEEKIESIRMHFMLIHQETSSHKINILTIIQAIFVPLTFLAGVYGMNFNNMPELSWKYAYFFVWGAFITLAIILLYYFKKNGWFE